MIFTKSMPEKITVVGVVSDKHMDLFTQTMYAANKKSLPTVADTKASVITSEAASGIALTDSIPTPAKNVNIENLEEEKSALITNKTLELLDRYDKGEITR